MKTCSKCGVEKPLTEFYVRQTGKVEASCKLCGIKSTRLWREQNRERDRKNARTWYANNLERAHETDKKWRRKNRARQCLALDNWRKKGGEKQLNNKIADRLRDRIRDALGGICKSTTTLRLVGCSIPELRACFERKFLPGMAWENYGAWHIDHIKPCAKFDLTNPEHQKQCFHFSNLQPLWATDNLRKNSKYAGD